MRTIAYLAMAGVLSAAGCDLQMGGELVDNPPPSPPTTTTGEVRADGFPCEVRAVLQARCGECHTGNTYTVSFHSREIWLAPWRDGMTLGQHAAMRIANETMPPPTAPDQPTDAERALVADWVAAGVPPGACAPLTRPPLR
jgi:uncharacterized membrane protein